MFGMALNRPSLTLQLTMAWTSSRHGCLFLVLKIDTRASRMCAGKRRTLRATIVTFTHMTTTFQFLSNMTRFLDYFFEITTNLNF